MITTSILLFITFICILTAGISAVFGMAGGVIVFMVLSFFVDLPTAIALHAVIQFVSNFSRVIIAFRTISWRTVGWFSLLLIPMTYLGSLALKHVNENALQIVVGLLIIGSIFIPKKGDQKYNAPNWMLVIMGAICSFLSMLVGAIGPLLSAFLNQTDLKKESLVSTKATAQIFNHLVKIVMMSAVIDFDFSAYKIELGAFVSATLIGSVIGNQILKRINDLTYDRLNNIVLGILASMMIVKGIIGLSV